MVAMLTSISGKRLTAKAEAVFAAVRLRRRQLDAMCVSSARSAIHLRPASRQDFWNPSFRLESFRVSVVLHPGA